MTTAHPGPRIEAETLPEAVAALRARGLRLSGARRLVLEALYATDAPLSAEEIAEGTARPRSRSTATSRRSSGSASYSTCISVTAPGATCSQGESASISSASAAARTARSRPEQLDGVRDAVEAATGFRARFSHFPIVGLCADCAARPGSSN